MTNTAYLYNPFTERNPANFGYSPRREALPRLQASLRAGLTGQATLGVPRPGQLRHIDFSWFNAGDMAALKTGGVPMAWFRISMGIAGVDNVGLEKAIAFHAAGGIPLFYHLFTDYDGLQQATHFKNTVAPVANLTGWKGIVALDQETPMANNTLRKPRSEAFCNTIKATGLKTALYTNNNYANTWGLKGAWIKPAFDFTWQAQWTSGSPTQIDGWYLYSDPEEKKRCIHQSGIYDTYWWEDPVPGITSDIDIDWYYGTLADLTGLLGITPQPTLEERVAALEAIAHTH